MLIKIKDTGETITINDILSYAYRDAFRFKFSNGTVVTTNDINITVNGNNDGNILYGCGGNDTIIGNDGSDTIYGNGGDDILVGGKGNDALQGDYGDDAYVYSKGDGNDTIYDYQGKNTIEFKDINKGEVEFSAEGDNVLIAVKDTQGHITVENFFRQNNNFRLKFADGSMINGRDLSIIFNGSSKNDIFSSYDGNDILDGKDGNDMLYGGAGNDTLVGGIGDDYLKGEDGNDTYIYHKGDGNDTIYDLQGSNIVEFKNINRGEVAFTESRGSLLVTIRDTNEQITIMNFFNSESSSMSFKFADGTILDENGAKAAALIGDNNDNMIQGYDSNDILKGNGGNDTIYGGKGDDDIEGGIGNDILIGNEGIDTYVFGRGDGQDVIYALDADCGRFNIDANGNYNISYYHNQQNVKGTDIIKFKEGISKNDLIFERAGANGHDLLIKIKDTDDSITVKDMFSDAVSSRGIDKIEFADGSFIVTDDIYKNTALVINRADQKQATGSVYSDTIIGNDQDNIVYANNGDDTLAGGKGNDYLDGGNGSDVYIYNKGDGNDTIYDANGTDTIKFGSGISKQDIIVKRTNVENAQDYRNITISFKNSPNDSITILDVSTGNTTNDSNIIETFEFENGDRLSFEDIKKLSLIGTEGSENIIGYVHANNIIKGGGGDDKLYGQDGNDTIDGREGDDIIEGGSGNDTLIGGAGNDTLNGGIGDDVYVYNKGDGNDTIVDTGGTDIIKFGQGINKEDLVATKSGDEHYKDIILTFKNSPSDSIVIKEVFIGENIKANNKIETLEFANSEKIKLEDIELNIIGSKENDDIRGYNDFSNIIKGNGGDDTLYGGNINDTIYGGDGNDRLYGGRGNDTLMGGKGNDILEGEEGDDIIEGGSGNDTLYGGSGEDVYLFKRGDGQDTVYADGNDIVKFKAGLTQNDLIFRRSESLKDGFDNGLILKIKDSHDSIVIRGAFKDENNSYGIKGVEFDDGSFMSFAEIKRKVLISSDQEQTVFEGFNSDDTIIGGDGNDYLSGNGGNDTLIGNNGDDRIDGGDGDDIITGGKGDDELSGGSGSDTYVFGRGDGKDNITNYDDDPNKTDIIKFQEGISRDDLILQKLRTFKYGSDFLIKIKRSDDSILVKNMFDIEDNNYVLNEKSKIDKIEFGDGSFMDIEDIKQALKNNNVIIHGDGSYWKDSEGSDEDDEICGNDDDNSLKGNKGDDILVGGKGSDSLYGGEGNDTYVFGRGDGEDTIYNYDPAPNRRDIIKFKEGITKNDLIFKRSLNYNNQNDSLIIEIKGTSDSVTVSGMFRNENTTDRIDGIEFSDGTFMDFNDIKQKVLTSPDSNDNNIYGFSSDDVLIGGDGNDYLDGCGGNDTMKGGLGNDTYTYDYRSGHIVIEDIGGEDTLYINAPKTGLKFKKDGNDLFISSSDNHDQSIRIKNHFLSDNYSIDKISFNPHGEYFLTKDDINKLANAVHLSSEGGNNYLSDKDKKDNIYTYAGGKVTISDNGGDDRVVFKLDNPGDGLFYLSNGRDLKISTNKIDASNNDVLEIKNFFVSRSSIIESFDINDYWSVTAESIYKAFGKTYPTQATPPNNNPTPPNGDNLIGGKEDNVFTYTGGKKSITDTGGNDKVIFANQGSRVFYSSDGVNLKISTSKIDSSNKDVLEVKNFFSDKNAESIYQAFGKTYPTSADTQNAPLALLGTPNNTNKVGLNDNNASDT